MQKNIEPPKSGVRRSMNIKERVAIIAKYKYHETIFNSKFEWLEFEAGQEESNAKEEKNIVVEKKIRMKKNIRHRKNGKLHSRNFAKIITPVLMVAPA